MFFLNKIDDVNTSFTPISMQDLPMLTLSRMGSFWAAHGRGAGGQTPPPPPPLPKICHTFPTMMKLSSYTLPKEDPKNI